MHSNTSSQTDMQHYMKKPYLAPQIHGHAPVAHSIRSSIHLQYENVAKVTSLGHLPNSALC